MSGVKRCIFHLPIKINEKKNSGSSIRPVKMMEAFETLGYQVDKVIGYGNERAECIKEIKKNIKKGIKYDFLYSESSTMPTLLTERNHIPRYPFLDFSFLKFCKKNGMPIGLFYRDIQWKFPLYRENVSLYKKCVSIPMYYYDLWKYSKLLDKFYLPDNEMGKWLEKHKKLMKKRDVLMPGGDKLEQTEEAHSKGISKDYLNLFYVGGIKNIYDLTEFFKAIFECEFVRATICCREKEWESEKERYGKYINERIKIVHETGEELKKFYNEADVGCILIGQEEYAKMGMPVKLFEYMSFHLPVIGTEGTAVGTFISNHDVGWVVKGDKNTLISCFEYIYENSDEVRNKADNVCKIQKEHTWEARAEKVAKDMKNIKGEKR